MKYTTGLRIDAKINNIVDFGIFVDLPHHRHGLIHQSDFGERWSIMKDKYEVGQELRVVVVDNKNGKIALSVTRVNDPELIDSTNSFNQKKNFVEALTTLKNEATQEIKDLKEELK